MAIDYAAKRQG